MARILLVSLASLLGTLFFNSCASSAMAPAYLPNTATQSRAVAKPSPAASYTGSPPGLVMSPAAESAAGSGASRKKGFFDKDFLDRPGLGTGRGHWKQSQMNMITFNRVSNTPLGNSMIHYNDATGVDAMGRTLGGKTRSYGNTKAAGFVDWGLVDSNGKALPTYTAGGRTLVRGQPGAEYEILAHNRGDRRVELVLSVDGIDVRDGKPASVKKRGYLLDPGKQIRVDGWRNSSYSVSAFEFSSVPKSLSATKHKTARNVGVVGLAVFAENPDDWHERTYRTKDTGDRLGAQAF